MQWVIVSLIPPPMMAENARVASQQTKRKITRKRKAHSIIHLLMLRIPLLGLLLGTLRLSSAVLQLALAGLGELGVRHAVCLDVLLAVGRELGLPVALALLLLLEGVLLVALEVLGVGVGCWWVGLVLCMGRRSSWKGGRHTARRLLELQAGGRGDGPPRGSGDEGLTGSESGSGGDAGEHFECGLWLLLFMF
jgi:hypothetical protein